MIFFDFINVRPNYIDDLTLCLTGYSSYESESSLSDFPEHVVRVYRADQACRYLPIHKETSAKEVVMLSLQEFGISDPSPNYSLCEVGYI